MGFLIRIFKFTLKLGVVVVGIGVIVSYARLSEHGDLRAELMQRIGDSYVGRLSIDGPTELQFTFPPSVVIKDVRIKNAKWASKPDMMRANTVVAEIDLIPLLQGQMAMPRLRMIGVDIVVETGPNGKTNWDELNDFETASGLVESAPTSMIVPNIAGTMVSLSQATVSVIGEGAQTVASVSLGSADVLSGGSLPCQ